VRQYLPKKTDFQKIDQKDVRKIQDKLNNRPRKVLGSSNPWRYYRVNLDLKKLQFDVEWAI
jgi:IS30 family transposase